MRNSPRLPLLLGIAVVLVVILVAMRSFGTAKDASVPVVGLGPVTVMPIGPVPDYAVAAVRKHLQTMGFRSTVQRLSPQPANFDTARRQWIAEALTSQVRTATPPATNGSTPMAVALTADDIYMTSRPDWTWVFSFGANDGSSAVLSTARIDPASYGLPADPQVVARRLEVMVTRIIGRTRVGAPTVSDPTCANGETMYSVEQIDQMRPELCLGSAAG